MAYIIDDDENRIQEIKDQLSELEIQTFSPEVVARNESNRNTGLQTGDGAATNPYPQWIPIRDFGTLGNLTLEILLNRTNSHVAKMTLNGDTDFAFSEPPGTNKMMWFILDVTIDATGGYTINLPASVEPASVVIDNAANARTVLRLQTTDGGVTYQAENLSTGGGGLSEPIILTVNTVTPETLPTTSVIDWSKNPNHITLDRDVEFSFSNLPASGSYEGLVVIIDVDGTGGYADPIWPVAVANPPSVSTNANTRTSVVLYTIDAGTTVTHATSVPSRINSGDVSLWANFPAVSDIDYATFDGINIDRLRFVVDSSVPSSNNDPSIFLDATGNMIQNVADLDGIIWKANNVEMAKIYEATAGVYRFDMVDHSIENAQDIRFQDTSGAVVFPGTDPAIGYDSTASRLILNMPTGGNLFVTNNNVIGSLQMNSDSITANIVNANDVLQLGVDVTVPTVPGEFRNDGTDVTVFTGGGVVNLSNISGTFADNVFRIFDNGDNTKQLAFEVSAITASTTRTITVPDANITVAGLNLAQTFTAAQSFDDIAKLAMNSDITFPTANLDIGTSSNFPDSIFMERLLFPATTGALTISETTIRRATNVFGATTGLQINVPTNEDFVISENGVVSQPALVLDMSAGIMQIDNPILTFKINNSHPLNITKADSNAAAFFSADGFDFDGGDAEFNDSSLTGVNQIDLTTAAGVAVGSLIMNDTSPDIFEIRLGSASDFSVTDNGTVRAFFDNTLLRWAFDGSNVLRLPQETQISDRTTAPSTPPSGFASLYVINSAGAQSLRVKFDNGTEKTIADDT